MIQWKWHLAGLLHQCPEVEDQVFGEGHAVVDPGQHDILGVLVLQVRIPPPTPAHVSNELYIGVLGVTGTCPCFKAQTGSGNMFPLVTSKHAAMLLV